MAKSNKNLHLTLSERQIIQRGIENGSTKTSIAATLGKDMVLRQEKVPVKLRFLH